MKIWQEYSSSKYALIVRVGFSVWHYTFKMGAQAMTLFYATKCCHLVS